MSFNASKNPVSCPRCPHNGNYVRHGGYRRGSDKKWIERWFCSTCEKTFSEATEDPEVYQKKRHLNEFIKKLLCSGVSQRRLSLLLDLHRTTLARKLKFLALQARFNQTRYLTHFVQEPITHAQFDELETSEHTKLKPLSVVLAVCEKRRKILGFEVSSMPAKGHLAKRALKKYGKRRDDRAFGMKRLISNIDLFLAPKPTMTSDQNPKYPGWIKHTDWIHQTVKGQRGCIVGQGELKKIGFDPLFSLNHTCAMMRANVNRLFRRTWCTTKKMEALVDHLWLYMDFHNTILT